jgi:hypothetical protein
VAVGGGVGEAGVAVAVGAGVGVCPSGTGSPSQPDMDKAKTRAIMTAMSSCDLLPARMQTPPKATRSFRELYARVWRLSMRPGEQRRKSNSTTAESRPAGDLRVLIRLESPLTLLLLCMRGFAKMSTRENSNLCCGHSVAGYPRWVYCADCRH